MVDLHAGWTEISLCYRNDSKDTDGYVRIKIGKRYTLQF